MSAAVARRPGARLPSVDPVLTLPAAVLFGLGIGWIGESAGVGGVRIAVDLLVSWTLVSASLLTLGRSRWRRSAMLLAATGFALLGGDLQWADADVVWTVGFLAEGLWLAVLAHFVVSFPAGRPWSAAAVAAITGAYVATVGGQALAAVTAGGSRDVVAIPANADRAEAIDRAQAVLAAAVALLVVGLVLRRLHDLGRRARLVQGPVFVAAAICALMLLAGLAAYAGGRFGATGLHMVAAIGSVLVGVGVMAGLLGSRLRRPGASELVVELQTGGVASLRDRLAAALDDETLELAYRIDGRRYVDAAGRPMDITGSPDRAVTLIRSGGQEVAALVHDPALLDDPALVESVRATAALVLENERLAAEVLAQLAEVRASRARLVAVADAERQRIERNLHDGLQQRLVTLCLDLGLAAGRADADAPAALARAHVEVEHAIVDLRELARGIHPTLLREEGLEAAVTAVTRRTRLPVAVHCAVGDRCSDAVELAAYLFVSEALTNVVKHASASAATVRIERLPATLRVEVADDGTGGARATSGSGLAGLRDRLAALDATLVVASEPGRGTTIRTEIPCAS